MSKLDAETGNKERTIDMNMIMKTVSIPGFNKSKGADFVGRLSDFQRYISMVFKDEIFLYNRVLMTGPDTTVLARDDNNNIHYGVNYASADYLGLANHPAAKNAAIAAIKKYGMSAGNVPSGLGSHEYSVLYLRLYLQLERELAEYWGMDVLIFPTGWMGGYGFINAIIRPQDHVIMDHISHNCLQEGAISATKNVKKF